MKKLLLIIMCINTMHGMQQTFQKLGMSFPSQELSTCQTFKKELYLNNHNFTLAGLEYSIYSKNNIPTGGTIQRFWEFGIYPNRDYLKLLVIQTVKEMKKSDDFEISADLWDYPSGQHVALRELGFNSPGPRLHYYSLRCTPNVIRDLNWIEVEIKHRIRSETSQKNSY